MYRIVAPGCLAQLAGGHQGGDRAGRHRLAALVDDEAAVGVTVEGQPDVGAGAPHLRLQVDQVGRIQRVRLVVREAAVELEVQLLDADRQAVEHGGHRVAGHPVAGVDHDVQRPDRGQVDQRSVRYAAYVGEQVLLA